MTSSDLNENIEVIFELFPVFNDGMLQEVDVPVFLDQVAKTLRVLNPISAKLDDLYCFVDGHFIADPNYVVENGDRVNREFIQILIDDKSFLLTVELSVLHSHTMPEFMDSMSNDQNRFVIFWQFDIDTLDLLCDAHDEIPKPLRAISFTFGNLINGHRFVTHLNDIGSAFNSESVTSNCNIISDVFVETNGKFNVLFKISYYNAAVSAYDHKICKFQFDADSVTEIITSLNRGIEFYFQLDFPPKLYLGQEEEDSGDDSTSRWVDTDLISRETIGRCNTFMIKLDFADYSDLAPLLSAMYSDYFEKSHPVVVTPISKYCVDYSDGLFENNFPFEVKYALECINSLSNAFKDDLYINNTKESFYYFIQSKLDEGQENFLIEVLHQLFQEYVDGEVQNAYTNFIGLFDELGENIRERINRTHHMMKKIILTPMRTIYLPPTPTRTKFMIENVNSNTMIIVYFRDDDKSHTSCDSFTTEREIGETDFTQFLADSQFRNYFLEEIVQRRLFKEHGLISAQPLKYLGTSVSQIFSYGILVQANSSSD